MILALQEYEEDVITEDNINQEVESIYLKGETKVFVREVELLHSNEKSFSSKEEILLDTMMPIDMEEFSLHDEVSNSFRTKLQNFRMKYDNQIDIIIVILVLALAFF